MRIIAISLGLWLLPAALLRAESQHIIMSTGGVTGVYYPAGGAMCQMVNERFRAHGLRCFVESSRGSVENLKRLRQGEIDFAIVQNDWKMHAWNGTDVFKEYGPDKSLRSVMGLYKESFFVVARADSNIRSLNDLKGKRINLGNSGSGQRATMEWVMRQLGWWKSDFSEIHEFESEDQAKGLCANTFDAFVFVAGSPNSSVKEATTDCESIIVPIAGEAIDKAVADSSMYTKTQIPGGLYRGNPNDVETFGVSAQVVSSSEVDPALVSALVQAIFEQLNQFKGLHPALARIDRDDLTQSHGSLPSHEGVESYLAQFAGMQGSNP